MAIRTILITEVANTERLAGLAPDVLEDAECRRAAGPQALDGIGDPTVEAGNRLRNLHVPIVRHRDWGGQGSE